MVRIARKLLQKQYYDVIRKQWNQTTYLTTSLTSTLNDNRFAHNMKSMRFLLGPILLTWFNFNPSMDK